MRHRPFLVLGMAAAMLAITAPAVPARQPAGLAGGRYIVVLNTEAGRPLAVARSHGLGRANLDFVYRHALRGYAGTFSGPVVAALKADPRVAQVIPDIKVRVADTQTNATWGIDRIDQPALPLSKSYAFTSKGANVTAYVIDTGIRTTHAEFGGRAVDGYDAVDKLLPAADCNGHGTHVAGTIGGNTYGVAKSVKLVAVRVLDCAGSGTAAGVIAGIDWVTADHDPGELAVANMSLGGGVYAPIDTAVANSIADGVVYGVAAGNSANDACKASPARTPTAITVAATTNTDARATYSNYGTCVDINAPGTSITSAWLTNDTATNTISGTSMATPHVVGAAARYLSLNPTATPQQVRDALVNGATANKVSGLTKKPYNTTPNKLLYLAPGA